MAEKTARVSVVMTPKMREALETLSAQQKRSMSNMAFMLLEQAIATLSSAGNQCAKCPE